MVAHMLIVSACKLSNPMVKLVKMKTGDALIHDFFVRKQAEALLFGATTLINAPVKLQSRA